MHFIFGFHLHSFQDASSIIIRVYLNKHTVYAADMWHLKYFCIAVYTFSFWMQLTHVYRERDNTYVHTNRNELKSVQNTHRIL